MGVTNSKREYVFSETPLPSKWDALTKEYNSDNKKEQVENAKNNKDADKISKFIKDNTFLIKHFDNFMTDYKNKAETTALVKKKILPDRSDIKELLKGKNGNYNDELTQFLDMKPIFPYNNLKVQYTPDDVKLLEDITDKNEAQKKELYTKIIQVSIGALIHKKFKRIIVDYIFDSNVFGDSEAKIAIKKVRGDKTLEQAYKDNKGSIDMAAQSAKIIEDQKNKKVKGGTLIENNVVDNNLEKVKSIGGINPLKAAKSFIDDDNNSSSSDNSDNSSSSSSSSSSSRYNSDSDESDSDESYSDSDSDSYSDSDRSDESYSDRSDRSDESYSDRSNGNNKSDSDNSNSFNDNSSGRINPHRVDYIKGEEHLRGGIFDSNEKKVYKQAQKEIEAIFKKKKTDFFKNARALNAFMDIPKNHNNLLAMVYDGPVPGKWVNGDAKDQKTAIIDAITPIINDYTPDKKDEKTSEGDADAQTDKPADKPGAQPAALPDASSGAQSGAQPAALPAALPAASSGAPPGAPPAPSGGSTQQGGKYYKIKTRKNKHNNNNNNNINNNNNKKTRRRL